MLRKIRIALLLASVGLLAGFAAHYLKNSSEWSWSRAPKLITVPEGGVRSDAFSLRLLQLHTDDRQPSIVAPALMSNMLLMLADCTTGETRKDIEALRLYTGQTEHTAAPDMGVLIAAELGLPYSEKAADYPIMRLPFRHNLPDALMMFNLTLRQITNSGQPVVSGDTLTADTNLAIGLALSFDIRLEQPFYANHNKEQLFYYADGTSALMPMMRQRAELRYASAADGAWEAVALMLKPTHRREAESLALIAISPATRAAAFARNMSTEQFSAIREALATAAPRDCAVTMPILQSCVSRSWTEQLNQLGLQRLTDITSRDWCFTSRRIGLGVLAEQYVVRMTQPHHTDQQPNLDNAAHAVVLDNPFIWAICDLTEPTPPYLMGIYQ